MPRTSFVQRGLLAVATGLAAWWGMQGVHELGHVVAAWGTGGTVERVVLHPLTISRTDVRPNPRPLLVTWGGPLLGVVMPGIAAAAWHWRRWPGAYAWRFFAGFCLIANGCYLGIGSFEGVGDCGDLLRHGAPRWSLWLFGLVCVPTGLACWHGLGRHFGWGPQAEDISTRHLLVAWACCGGLAALGWCIGGE